MAWAAQPPHETTSTLPPRAAPRPAGRRALRVGLRPDAFFSLFYRYRNRRPDRGQGWGVKGRGCPASARSPPLPPALIPSISKVFVLHGERGDPSLWSTAGQLLLIICAGQTHSQRSTLATKPLLVLPIGRQRHSFTWPGCVWSHRRGLGIRKVSDGGSEPQPGHVGQRRPPAASGGLNLPSREPLLGPPRDREPP